MEDRREFLKRLARGAAYAAPVIYTLAAPEHLHAIVISRKMRMMMMWWFGAQSSPNVQSGQNAQPDAPWGSSPPFSEPPGSQPPPAPAKPPGGGE